MSSGIKNSRPSKSVSASIADKGVDGAFEPGKISTATVGFSDNVSYKRFIQRVNGKEPDDNGALELKSSDIPYLQGKSVQEALTGTQSKLVSGDNIKTINGESILGSGNIEIKLDEGVVKSVNDIKPDLQGNVELFAENILTSGDTSVEETLQNKQDILISGESIKTINDQSILGPGNIEIKTEGMVNVTYSELKDLYESNQLEPGLFYRITDYETIVSPYLDAYHVLALDDEKSYSLEFCENNRKITYCREAGHQFDIIVLAIAPDQLSSDAWALPHERDLYFKKSRLSNWKIKYDINNDMSRYEWADGDYLIFGNQNPSEDFRFRANKRPGITAEFSGKTYQVWDCFFAQGYTELDHSSESDFIYFENPDSKILEPVGNIKESHPGQGKGVIYYMQDEFGNSAGYDFKNIQFLRYGLRAKDPDWVNKLAYDRQQQPICYGSCITEFNSRIYNDFTALSEKYTIDSDIIDYYYTFDIVKSENHFDLSMNNESNMNYSCTSNTVEGNSISSLENYFPENTSLKNIPYRQGLGRNVLVLVDDLSPEKGFEGIFIDVNAFDNTFSHSCSAVKAGRYLNNWISAQGCFETTIGNNCSDNIFEGICADDIIDNHFCNNSAGGNFYNNIIGSYCQHNKFPDGLEHAKMAADVKNCIIPSFEHLDVRDGIESIDFYSMKEKIPPEVKLSGSINVYEKYENSSPDIMTRYVILEFSDVFENGDRQQTYRWIIDPESANNEWKFLGVLPELPVLKIDDIGKFLTLDETLALVFKGLDTYDGPYLVTPSFQNKKLETSDLLMTEDVNVNPIQVERTTNPQGGKTIYIGGETNG